MDKTAPVLELRDIHLPDGASIWPLAPGWWLVIILACIALFLLVRKLLAQRKRKQLIALMQHELDQVYADYKQHQGKNKFAQDVSDLLKRFVRYVLNDSHASSQTGEQWVNYLIKYGGNETIKDFGYVLTQAPYVANPEYDVPAFYAMIKNYFPKAINTKDKKKQQKEVSNA